MSHPQVMEAIFGERWAIVPEFLNKIVSIAEGHGNIEQATAIREMRKVQGAYRAGKTANGVAIIPVVGPIFPRANMMTEYSGATSVSMLTNELQAAIDDPEVKSIVLNFDSPGGVVTGISEFADMVKATSKRVVGYVYGSADSAAYWIASACDAIYMSQTADVGSIGVVVSAFTDKERMKKEGIERHEIVSSVSPNKRPDISTEGGRSQVQRMVDAMAEVFVSTVAVNRGVSVETVVKKFGGGEVFIGQEAVNRGMADGITTLETLINNGADMTTNNPASAAAATPAPVPSAVVPQAPAPVPPAAPAAIDTSSPEFLAAVAAATAQATASERTRIAECESLKAKFPGYEASVDKHKHTPGMTKGQLMEILVDERQAKEAKVAKNRDEDLEEVNSAAAVIGNTGDIPEADQQAAAVALMLQGASGHESRQYTGLAEGKTEGAKLKGT
jgi:signal peptide peptidase SppA